METPAAKSEAKPASDKDNKSKDKDKDKKKSAVEERRSYPLRVGVAKPADIYTPTFGNASGASPAVTGKAPDASKTPASKPGQKPGAAAGSGVGTRVERVLGKRKRNSKTEFLVKWVGRDASANSWEPAKGVDERLVEQYEEVRTAPRIAAFAIASPTQAASHARSCASCGRNGGSVRCSSRGRAARRRTSRPTRRRCCARASWRIGFWRSASLPRACGTWCTGAARRRARRSG